MIILQISVIFLLPLLFFAIEKRWSWFKPIVMAYAIGIIAGNLAPESFDPALLNEVTGISIILAIPLMLFPTHIKSWVKQPKTLLLAYGLAAISTTLSVIVGWFIFKDELAQIAVISGMLEGVYTGGTVNLNAIAIAFNAPESLIVLVNGYDMAISGIYLLGIFTFLPKLLGKVLPMTNTLEKTEAMISDNSFSNLSLSTQSIQVLKGISMAVLVIGMVAGISFWAKDKIDELIMVFGVTGVALLFSNIKWIRSLDSNMPTADYLMIVFGFSLGLQANLSEMFYEQSGVFGYFIFTYLLMLVFHLFLSWVFKVDVYAFLLSSVAAVFGPPFIGPVAESLNHRSMIASGIIIALMGNALGTYLGILLTKILIEF